MLLHGCQRATGPGRIFRGCSVNSQHRYCCGDVCSRRQGRARKEAGRRGRARRRHSQFFRFRRIKASGTRPRKMRDARQSVASTGARSTMVKQTPATQKQTPTTQKQTPATQKQPKGRGRGARTGEPPASVGRHKHMYMSCRTGTMAVTTVNMGARGKMQVRRSRRRHHLGAYLRKNSIRKLPVRAMSATCTDTQRRGRSAAPELPAPPGEPSP